MANSGSLAASVTILFCYYITLLLYIYISYHDGICHYIILISCLCEL